MQPGAPAQLRSGEVRTVAKPPEIDRKLVRISTARAGFRSAVFAPRRRVLDRLLSQFSAAVNAMTWPGVRFHRRRLIRGRLAVLRGPKQERGSRDERGGPFLPVACAPALEEPPSEAAPELPPGLHERPRKRPRAPPEIGALRPPRWPAPRPLVKCRRNSRSTRECAAPDASSRGPSQRAAGLPTRSPH